MERWCCCPMLLVAWATDGGLHVVGGGPPDPSMRATLDGHPVAVCGIRVRLPRGCLGGTHPALCARCAKRRLFSTPGSHGSQGPGFCTPDAVLNGSRTLL